MIIIGYQGIGKSTLAGKNNCIDLESCNFKHNGVRHDDWYIYYGQIADHLSKQGFTVFVSSHEVVRKYLRMHSKEKLMIICPSTALKDAWIEKLRERYEKTKLEKDYNALKNAEDKYEENIADLMHCGINVFPICKIDYVLANMIELIK